MKTLTQRLVSWFRRGLPKSKIAGRTNTAGEWFISEEANHEECLARALESCVEFGRP